MLKGKTRILLHQTKDFGTVIPDFHPRSPKLSQHGAAPGSTGCGAVWIKQPPPPGSICPWILHSCRPFLQLLLKITEARGAQRWGCGSGCSPGQGRGGTGSRAAPGLHQGCSGAALLPWAWVAPIPPAEPNSPGLAEMCVRAPCLTPLR